MSPGQTLAVLGSFPCSPGPVAAAVSMLLPQLTCGNHLAHSRCLEFRSTLSVS
ncbi:uncharacterized protein THITE_2112494 [Thermothielavioides terrestris NRRL 8126]|uniref:Uncharacterized protein n=1 Tax=Thermothielavioides terrestris (strain ATCC 38088 / NRRL 8126) TaxID=578455 RepID=G2QZ35_THETT|nr:uncharacterized protein THITE_2112494 [Thermothielavioides terrestris NRRL 8126]AEO65467.1 hypothetical protein THITE_2112494 [Thermothielavioides terrestris NRRL 8126]